MLRGLGVFGRFVLLLVLARISTPEDLGRYGLVTATVSFTVFLVGFQYINFTMREGVRDPSSWAGLLREQSWVQSRAYLLAVVPLGIAVASGILSIDLALWSALLVVTDHLSLEAQRLLAARSRPIQAHVVFLLRTGAWAYAWSAWALLGSPPFWTLWVAWSIGGASAALYGAWHERDLIRAALREEIDHVRKWAGVRVGTTYLLDALAGRAILTVDRYLLAFFTSDAEVGIYTFHASAAASVLLMVDAVVVVTDLPAVIGAHSAHPDQRRIVERAFRRRLFWVGLGMTSILVALAPLAYQLVDPLYGANWVIGALLLLAQFIEVIGLGLHYRLYAAHRDRSILSISTIGLVAAVAGHLVLIPRFGAIGAAVATGATFLVTNLARGVWIRASRGDI